MKLGGRERIGDEVALEELFAQLPVTVDWTMGFLTAVSSGPDAIAPQVWIPELVPAAFDEDGSAGAKVDLLARLFGAVGETLRTSPAIVPPEPDRPAQEAVEFCRGYVHGARMHATWRNDEVAVTRLVPFEALAKEGVDAAERERLGSHVAGLHAYWQSKRQVVHETPKVGRNDRCPCGSGKKHKKCCLV